MQDFETRLKRYLDRRKNRIIGAILHAYDTKAEALRFKALVKTKINELSKEAFDLCVSFVTGDNIFLNELAERTLKEVEKASAKTETQNCNDFKNKKPGSSKARHTD